MLPENGSPKGDRLLPVAIAGKLLKIFPENIDKLSQQN
jgi:hypothetical protein